MIRPLADRVVVRRITAEEKTESGLYIPDASREKPLEGVVLAVGKGKYRDGSIWPVDVTENDHILFGKYSGAEVKIDGEEVLILREEEILGVL